MIRIGKTLDAAVAKATAGTIDGSSIIFIDAQHNILARFPVTRWTTDGVSATLQPTSLITIDRSGLATRFICAVNSDVILSGDIPEDMALDRTDLVKGGTLEISSFTIGLVVNQE